MANREPFKLRGLLFVWNVALAVFSLMGAGRALPEMAYGLYHFGFKYTACDASVLLNSRIIGLWAWLFTFSKLVELGERTKPRFRSPELGPNFKLIAPIFVFLFFSRRHAVHHSTQTKAAFSALVSLEISFDFEKIQFRPSSRPKKFLPCSTFSR